MTDDELLALTDEALDRALEQTDHLWSASLADLLSAPADLAERTAEEVRQALLDRSTVVAAGDLLSVGWNTLRILFADTERDTERDT